MKLGIIGGAGLLGTTAAFCAGMQDFLDEIKLVDLKENVAQSHVMDMGQIIPTISKTKITFGTYDDLKDCEIILIAASTPERQVEDRNERLYDNLGLVRNICKSLKPVLTDQVIINTTNPVDIFNLEAYRILGLPKERLIGFSINDTVRLKWAISMQLNVSVQDIDCICIGEHGDGQVAILSQAMVKGEKINLTPEQEAGTKEFIGQWYRNWNKLDSKRTTGWTSGYNLAYMIKAIATNSDDIIPCSAILDGEYGQSGLSIGVPVQLGEKGIRKIVDIGISDREQASFNETAAKIKDLLKLLDKN